MTQLAAREVCDRAAERRRQSACLPLFALSHPYIPGLWEEIAKMLRVIVAVLMLAFAAEAGATEAGWALLRDGEHVVLLRHAMAPGAADPGQFRHREMLDPAQPLRTRQTAGAQDRRAFCGPRRAHRARADQPLLPDEGNRPPRLRQRRKSSHRSTLRRPTKLPARSRPTLSCRRSATIPDRAISSSSPIWRRSRR